MSRVIHGCLAALLVLAALRAPSAWAGGDGVIRLDPVTEDAADFLDEWVSLPWKDAERWSSNPSLKRWHERLNGRRYHDDWLQNLLASASLGGYRRRIAQPPTP